MPLTDLECRKAKAAAKLRKLSDMGGLQLWVYPTGSRLWRYAYRFGGKQKLLAIGKYPDVTLIQAREARDNARKMLVEGKDPSHTKRLARLEKEHPGDSFEVVTVRIEVVRVKSDRRLIYGAQPETGMYARVREEQRQEIFLGH